MYVCMYVCLSARMFVRLYDVCMHACMHACTHAPRMCVRTYVCRYVRTYICMHVQMDRFQIYHVSHTKDLRLRGCTAPLAPIHRPVCQSQWESAWHSLLVVTPSYALQRLVAGRIPTCSFIWLLEFPVPCSIITAYISLNRYLVVQITVLFSLGNIRRFNAAGLTALLQAQQPPRKSIEDFQVDYYTYT